MFILVTMKLLLYFITCSELLTVVTSLLFLNINKKIKLTEKEKYDFMSNIITWTKEQNVLETQSCFAINFGYIGSLPIPQA